MKKYIFISILLILTLFSTLLLINNKPKEKTPMERYLRVAENIELSDSDRYEGYKFATYFIVTKNIDMKKAIDAMKPYFLYKDGNPCNESYRMSYEIRPNNRIRFNVTDPTGEQTMMDTPYMVIDSSLGEYVYATPYSFERGTLIAKMGSVKVGVTSYDMFSEALKARYRILNMPELDINLDFNYCGEVYDTDYFTAGNGNNYSCAVRVVSTNKPIEKNDEVILEEKYQVDDITNNVDKFTELIYNNPALKITFAIVGTILCGLIILFIFKFIRRTFRLLRD